MTLLKETALAAAREALARINPLVRLDGDDVRVAEIFQKHFQPLLAKVEGERDALQEQLVKSAQSHPDGPTKKTYESLLTALRADLAAKEAALVEARKNIELTNAIASANISAANESQRLAVENYEDEKHRAIVLRDMLEAPLPAIPEDWNNRWIDLAIEDYASKYLKDSAPEYVTMNRHRMFNCIKTHCPDPRQIMQVEHTSDHLQSALASRADKGGAKTKFIVWTKPHGEEPWKAYWTGTNQSEATAIREGIRAGRAKVLPEGEEP